MEFDADYAPSRVLLGRYFYKSLKPSIKLWINEKSWELLFWDNLIKKLSQAKAKAKIQNKRDLNQYCPWSKKLLKLIKESQDEQSEKAQKNCAAL